MVNFHDPMYRCNKMKKILTLFKISSRERTPKNIRHCSPIIATDSQRKRLYAASTVAEAYLQPRFTPGSLEEAKLSRKARCIRNETLVKLG